MLKCKKNCIIPFTNLMLICKEKTILALVYFVYDLYKFRYMYVFMTISSINLLRFYLRIYLLL